MTEKDLIIQDLRRENAKLRAKLAKDTNVHTNADRIRSMSDEMLKEFICSILQCKYCQFGSWERCEFLEWLKQPAEE